MFLAFLDFSKAVSGFKLWSNSSCRGFCELRAETVLSSGAHIALAQHSRAESLVSQTAAAGNAAEMGSFQGLAFRAESQEGEYVRRASPELAVPCLTCWLPSKPGQFSQAPTVSCDPTAFFCGAAFPA